MSAPSFISRLLAATDASLAVGDADVIDLPRFPFVGAVTRDGSLCLQAPDRSHRLHRHLQQSEAIARSQITLALEHLEHVQKSFGK